MDGSEGLEPSQRASKAPGLPLADNPMSSPLRSLPRNLRLRRRCALYTRSDGSHRWPRTNKHLFQRQTANQFALVGSGSVQRDSNPRCLAPEASRLPLPYTLMVRVVGLEPTISCVQGRWDDQLPYTRIGDSDRTRTGIHTLCRRRPSHSVHRVGWHTRTRTSITWLTAMRLTVRRYAKEERPVF